MKKNWKDIWNNRETQKYFDLTLENLIKINGFDTGVGSYDCAGWRKMIKDLIINTPIETGCKLLEIGCGSGAFLYALSEQVDFQAYGIDYSERMLDIAKLALPDGNFVKDEATSKVFLREDLDIIVSHSVFQYFPSIDYAYQVLENCSQSLSAGGTLVLLDVNDKDFENVYHAERIKNYIEPQKYYEEYKDLMHLFFEKNELVGELQRLGFSKIKFFDHSVGDYGNSKFRFNLICKKKPY